MDFLQVLYYLLLSLLLFFILNYFKKFENKVPSVMIIIPVIYIFLISELPGISKDFIYFVIVFEFLLRIYYEKVILAKDERIDINYYIQNYGISFIISYILTECFIRKVDTVFLSLEDTKFGIWFLIVLFLYKVFNGEITIKLETNKNISTKLKEETIVVRYAKFKNQYSSLVKNKDKDFSLLIYAIMIYESSNRSKFLRGVDKIIYRFTGKVSKMGIMQVESNKELTDEESIKQVIKEINKLKKDNKSKKKLSYHDILNMYYLDQNKVDNILEVHNVLKDFEKK